MIRARLVDCVDVWIKEWECLGGKELAYLAEIHAFDAFAAKSGTNGW